MKILFLALDIDIGSQTGDSVHVKELVTSLAKLGNQVTMVLPYTKKASFESEELKKHRNLNVILNKNSDSLRTLTFCRKVVKEYKPDVIYERRYSAKIGATLSQLMDIPLIIEINGLVEEEAEIQGTTEKKSLLNKKLKKKMRKRFFDQAKVIVAVTEGIKRELCKQYRIASKKIIVIHNGANTELFRPLDQNECRKELELDLDKKYVCFVGKLVDWQGVDYLLNAVPLIIKEKSETRFMIVGDGESRSDLQSLANKLKIDDVVTFTGSVPYEDVPKYINASDICVVLKREITSGYSSLKVYEYMACGKPIVASNAEGFEILSENMIGINVNPQSEKDVTNAVIKLLKNPDLRNEMGLKGREVVVKEHSWTSVASKVAALCKSVTM